MSTSNRITPKRRRYHIFIETLIEVMGLENTIKYLTYVVKLQKSTLSSFSLHVTFSSLVDWARDTAEGDRYWRKFYDILYRKMNENPDLGDYPKLTYEIFEDFLDDMKSKKPEPIKQGLRHYIKPKEQTKKENTMIAVFNKGVPNIKGLFYQLAATGAKEVRPFVLELIQKEEQRIINILKTKPKMFTRYQNTYGNIKLASLVNTLQKLQKTLLETEAVKFITLDPKIIVAFYEFEKEKALKNKKAFSWFNEQITQAMMQKETETILFNSKKFKISVNFGYAYLTEFKQKETKTYSAPIKYNEVTNTFYV